MRRQTDKRKSTQVGLHQRGRQLGAVAGVTTIWIQRHTLHGCVGTKARVPPVVARAHARYLRQHSGPG